MITLTDAGVRYCVDFKEDGRVCREPVWALRDITASIGRGESVAVIGENGSGKTTLLKLIAGVLKADKGTVVVRGRAAGIMEIGCGFHPELTGVENIRLVAPLYGLSRSRAEERIPLISAFASLGRFINAPVKSYSQGMLMRLAFAIAINIELDILLIDDTFSVGDAYAQKKCVERIFSLRDRGVTIICVSHDLEMARRLCPRALFLREGRLVMDGAIDRVAGCYLETVGDKQGIAMVESGEASAVFNNGGLMLRWKGEPVTTHPAESFFRLAKKEYLSLTALWRVERDADGTGFTATGIWPESDARQRWKMKAAGGGRFELSVFVDSPRAPEMSETRFFLSPAFTRWSSLEGEDDFPREFACSTRWVSRRVEEPASRFIAALDGLESGLSVDRGGDLPAECEVGNSGADLASRVLQFRRQADVIGEGNGCFSCFSSLLGFHATSRELRDRRELAGQAQRSGCRVSLDPLTLLVSGGKLEVLWRHARVSRGSGLVISFTGTDGRSYSSRDGVWDSAVADGHGIRARIFWPHLPAMRVRVSLAANGVVEIHAGMPVAWERMEIQLCLDPGYGRWQSSCERGGFERTDASGNVLLSRYVNSFLALQGNGLPNVEFSAGKGVFCSYIFKDSEGVNLRFVGMPGEEAQGKELSFHGSVSFGHPALSIDRVAGDPRARLKKGKLAFEFLEGRGRIFWNGHELTSGLGVYTSVFWQGSWIDSLQAQWKTAREGDELTAWGRCPWFPLRQQWKFSLPDDRTVSFTVICGKWERMRERRAQVNVMLSPDFGRWNAGKAKGFFPRGFIAHNGKYWQRVWSGETPLISSGPKGMQWPGRKLPPVGLRRGEADRGIFAVENTDDLFRCRVLQFEPHTDKSLFPGEEECLFRGTIRVGR